MIDCAYCEIGKYLGLPTQAYIALSDAKLLDAQAGLETGDGRDAGRALRDQQHLGARACSTSRAARAWRSWSSTTRSAA